MQKKVGQILDLIELELIQGKNSGMGGVVNFGNFTIEEMSKKAPEQLIEHLFGMLYHRRALKMTQTQFQVSSTLLMNRIKEQLQEGATTHLQLKYFIWTVALLLEGNFDLQELSSASLVFSYVLEVDGFDSDSFEYFDQFYEYFVLRFLSLRDSAYEIGKNQWLLYHPITTHNTSSTTRTTAKYSSTFIYLVV